MRIIKPSRIRQFSTRHVDARASLDLWLITVKRARWRHLIDVRQVFKSADDVRVASGRTVVIFNIARNRYRLITAIHYNMGKVFVLRLLTHAEYDMDRWKEAL